MGVIFTRGLYFLSQKREIREAREREGPGYKGNE
jgi:hypothetical protein